MAVHDMGQVRKKTKTSPEKYNLTSTDADMIHSVEHIDQAMDTHLKSSIIEKAGNWISYKEKWICHEDGILLRAFIIIVEGISYYLLIWVRLIWGQKLGTHTHV